MGRVVSKPSWLKVSIPGGKEYNLIKKSVEGRGLHTVCTEARCPNIGECFSCGTATFMIMGSICSRNCKYCAIDKGTPEELTPQEPKLIGEAVKNLQLKYVVITSVTRDDLPDGGADFLLKQSLRSQNLIHYV
jgi:lipoic acid synthetase